VAVSFTYKIPYNTTKYRLPGGHHNIVPDRGDKRTQRSPTRKHYDSDLCHIEKRLLHRLSPVVDEEQIRIIQIYPQHTSKPVLNEVSRQNEEVPDRIPRQNTEI
jgi:hypothetical protein